MPKLVVGLTGGIGSGKTRALEEFSRLGAGVVCLDEIARKATARGGPAYGPILRRFGRSILSPSGELDRSVLGSRVFARPADRRWLERRTHPWILKKMGERIRALRTPVVVVDAPLLFEAGVESLFDLTLVVDIDRGTQLRRMLSRNGLERVQALRRIRSQLPLEVKRSRADVVVDNRGSLKDLKRKVGEYYRAFELIALGGRK